MIKDTWKKNYEQIPVEDLGLDIKNPRTDTGESITYEELIEELLSENIMDLIESISVKGYAAVSVLMAIKESGKYTVVDGNRRVLAVKILHSPTVIKNFVPRIISNSEYEKYRTLSQNKKEEVLNLTVVLYPDRKIAEREMAILHLEGEAVKKWKPLRQYRYFQNQLKNNSLSLVDLADSLGVKVDRIRKGIITIQLYELAKNNIIFSQIDSERIFNDKKFRTEKFQRAVVNQDGERLLGYSFSEETNNVSIDRDRQHLFDTMKAVLWEIYDPNAKYLLSAQFSIDDRIGFFKSIDSTFTGSKELRRLVEKQKEQKEVGQEMLFPSTPPAAIFTGESIERSKRKPSGLFLPSELPYKLNNRSLQKLYDELKDIQVDKFPNATHDLLRSFLECSLAEFLWYMEEYKNVKKNDKHTPKLGEMITYIINKQDVIDDRDVLDNLREIQTNWNQPYSLQRMNKVNHNKDYSSSESEVRIAWDKIVPLFKIILNPEKIKRKESE